MLVSATVGAARRLEGELIVALFGHVFVGLGLLDFLDLLVEELHAWRRLVRHEVEVDGGDLVLEEDADGGDGEGFPEEILVEECAADGVDALQREGMRTRGGSGGGTGEDGAGGIKTNGHGQRAIRLGGTHLAVPVVRLALLAASGVVYHSATHGNDSTQKPGGGSRVDRLDGSEAPGGYG